MITLTESLWEFGAAMLLGTVGILILRLRQIARKRATT